MERDWVKEGEYWRQRESLHTMLITGPWFKEMCLICSHTQEAHRVLTGAKKEPSICQEDMLTSGLDLKGGVGLQQVQKSYG